MPEAPTPVLEFFGLSEQPFAATADPRYHYATRQHKECLFRMWDCVDERSGAAIILGAHGSGKTTLLRKLLGGMLDSPNRYTTAFIASPIPSWTSYDLIEAILRQFHIYPADRSYLAGMEALTQFLVSQRERIVTVVIDDAQNLNKRGQIELLRLAQDIETPRHKLLNLVFAAQPGWMGILEAAPGFLQRVSVTFCLEPMARDEMAEMLAFRLKQAGAGDTGPVFAADALDLIHLYSAGAARDAITVSRNTLSLAARIGQRRITRAMVARTIQMTMPPSTRRDNALSEEATVYTLPQRREPDTGASPSRQEPAASPLPPRRQEPETPPRREDSAVHIVQPIGARQPGAPAPIVQPYAFREEQEGPPAGTDGGLVGHKTRANRMLRRAAKSGARPKGVK